MMILDECWEWRGDRNVAGYGRKKVNGRREYTHRLAYEWVHGLIPTGMYVCHTCDNPPCVNPNHLFLGTPRENSKDCVTKGRMLRGELHRRSKLTTDQVLTIRRSAEKGVTLARKLGVTKELIYAVRKRRIWKHV